eukprot:1158325-Pelagomonas_calceolata.AAC.7
MPAVAKVQAGVQCSLPWVTCGPAGCCAHAAEAQQACCWAGGYPLQAHIPTVTEVQCNCRA